MANGWWIGATNTSWSGTGSGTRWRNALVGGSALADGAVPGTAPTTDIASFTNSGLTAVRTVYLNGTKTVLGLAFTTYNRGTTLAGGVSGAPAANTINLGTSGINASGDSAYFFVTDANTIVALTSANTPFTIPSTNASYVSGPMTGTGFGIRKQSGGHLVLNGASKTYTGRTWANGGSLFIDVGLALPSAGGEALLIDNGAGVVMRTSQIYGTASNNYVWNFNNGVLYGDTGNQTMPATLNMTFPAYLRGSSTDTSGAFVVRTGLNSTINGEHVISATIGIQTGAVLTFNQSSGQTMEVSGVLGASAANAGSVVKNGAGTLTLSARNTFTGGTTVNAGTLNLNAGDGANSGAILGTLTVKSGATAVTTATNAIYGVLSGRLFVTVESGGAFNFGGNSSGTQSFECAFTIQGATVTGTKTDGSGINIAGVDSKIIASGTNTWSAGPSRFVINSAGIQVDSGTTTWSGVIADLGGGLDGPLIKSGAGTLALTGANTFTGGATINAGTVNLGVAQNGSTSGPLGASGTITLGGGTLQYSAANQHDYSSRFSTAASQKYYVDTNGQNVTWATALTSSGGALTKSGTGTLTLSGNNTFSGGVTLSAGGLILNSTNALGTGTFTINGGYFDTTAIRFIYLPIVINASFSFTGSNNLSQFNEPITLNTTPTITTNGSILTLGGDITGSYGIVKDGVGTLRLRSEGSIYTGTTTVNAGELGFTNIALIPNNFWYINGTGVLNYSSATDQTYSYSISGTGDLKISDGVLRMAGSVSSHTGKTVLAGGALGINGSGTLGTSTLRFESGRFFVTNPSTVSITNAIQIAGSFYFGSPDTNLAYALYQTTGAISLMASASIIVESATGPNPLLSLGGSISGVGYVLNKAGAGTLVLRGSSTYTGGTTISNGILAADNASALGTGTVSVSSGAKLAALASINGKLNIGSNLTNSGGTLRIGGS